MKILKGMPVVKEIAAQAEIGIKRLEDRDVIPELAVIRVGDREDDIAYEKGIKKRFSSVNAKVKSVILPLDTTQEVLEETIFSLNKDTSIHGILVFCPLPDHLSQDRIKDIIDHRKDVDGIERMNEVLVYEGRRDGCAPCTAGAVIEMLDYYGIDPAGKKVAIVGRSMVVGKPLAMLLLGKNATVTICHTKTVNLVDECKNA
ncbi:MAG: bifunctional 5,10-methylenetetrahydrofolate dehydrogenase/5,10-methenyltetrahydrofolate cyclohydrolase, partial [Lachnoclostridium sp.]|nr:bifunctional 5,10-methylenetetrahydrofolate dehydrogenase/5,10-methenyltetrahydrofolate cyclohydrolase [Lachnoclostridium sp.]